MPEATQSPPAVRVRSRKLRWLVTLPALIGLFLLCWYLGARYVWFNVHEVVPGQVYRSSQPSPAFLDRTVREKNIRCVLKLNSPKESDWSRDESAEAGQLGVKFIAIPMGATRLPRRDELLSLIEAINLAPRPLLIHCKIGADRTGVASMLVAMHDGATFDDAVAAQLTWRYMHVGHWGAGVEDVVPRYRAYRGSLNQPTGGWAEFVDFAQNHYDPSGKPTTVAAANTH